VMVIMSTFRFECFYLYYVTVESRDGYNVNIQVLMFLFNYVTVEFRGFMFIYHLVILSHILCVSKTIN
jgi:hypothetical protein